MMTPVERHNKLFVEAISELLEFYPDLHTEWGLASARAAGARAYQDTGNDQADYEAMRDAIEKSIPPDAIKVTSGARAGWTVERIKRVVKEGAKISDFSPGYKKVQLLTDENFTAMTGHGSCSQKYTPPSLAATDIVEQALSELATESHERMQGVIEDVMERGQKYGFTPTAETAADLIAESANLLDINLSKEEIEQAASELLAAETNLDSVP